MKTDHLIHLLPACFLAFAAMDVRAASEQELIATLQSAAGATEKCAACRQLRLIGTPRSVPALGALLCDERISHAARYALEPISRPEAGAALRDGLDKTSGLVKAGLVDSLGWRREPESIPSLVPLLADADANIAAAAASALGRIGGKDALAALSAARDTAAPAAQPAVLESLLRCAEREPSAIPTYRSLYESKAPEHVRTAAYRGLLLSDERDRADLLRNALAGEDRAATRAALQVVRELDDERVLDACASMMASLPPEGQIAVLDALAKRGRPALSAFSAALEGRQPAVRIAAFQAIAEMNDVSAVPLLAGAAARGDKSERDAAVDALSRLHGPGAREALLAHLRKAKPEAKAELLRALGERGEPEAAAAMLQIAGEEQEPVRAAALRALARLAAADTLVPLLDLASGSKEEGNRAAIARTVVAICANCRDKEKCAGPVIAAMSRGGMSERLALMPALSRIGTHTALAAARAASEDANAEIGTEAIRVLSQWPTADAVPLLLDLGRTLEDERRHALALRGCIGLARLETDHGKRLSILRQALTAAKRPEEKRQALGEIGKIPTREAMQAAQALAGDPVLGEEAAVAVAQIRQRVEPAAAKPTAGGPFIRDWQVCGPYSQPGVTGALKVFDIAFGPERSGEKVEWKPAPKADRVNLAALFPGQTDCAAYLKTEIISAQDRDATLLLGSDDGVKAWLNGAVVHGKNVDRPTVPDQDSALIKLKKGTNVLMLKITQGGGGWMACARIASGPAAPAAHAASVAGPPPKPSVLPKRDAFAKLRLSDQFYAEGAYCGDFNRDGKMDVAAGPFWFEGPDFTKRHEYRPAKTFDPKGYSDNFLAYTGDFNGDGWADILCVGFPGKETCWYENPGGKEGPWKQRIAYPNVGNESPVWGDISGDGRPDLIFCNDGYLGYAAPDPARPDEPWVFHAVSKQDKRYFRFTHGVGFGDINGDGRADAVESIGWWEQPAKAPHGQPWTFHPQQFAQAAAQMLVTDVDGDGLADIVTAWHCHLYGMVWWKQIRSNDGAINWKQHVILPPAPDLNSTDFRVSQMHALDLVDMNGDGLKDIITGKRFWAHGPTGDKEPDAPAVVFWFELRRDGKGGATFVPHLIDDDSGVGTQVAAADLNGDARPDVIVGNKKGIFLHLSQPRETGLNATACGAFGPDRDRNSENKDYRDNSLGVLAADDVLSIRDGRFYLDGRPFAEISFNKFDLLWELYDQLAAGQALNNDNPKVAALNRALADLRALGFRTIRVFSLPWGPLGPAACGEPGKRALLYAALDKMVQLCEEHGLGVVWCLSLGSFTDTRVEPGKGWTRGEEQLRELVANPASRGRKLAFQYLDETVARYRHRKAVVMWEVHNELTLSADIGDARGVYEGERMPNLAQVAAFLDAAARRIKAADPLRLVNSGGSAMREHQWHLHQGAGWKLDTLDDQLKCFRLLYASSAVDVVDIHYYPGRNPGAMISDGSGGRAVLDLKGYMNIARQIGKPLMLGEFGRAPVARTDTEFWRASPDYFESYADVKAAKPWMARILDDVVEAGVPLSYWWCYQSERPMDQRDPHRMDIDRERNPELVGLVVAANRRLKAKLAVDGAAHQSGITACGGRLCRALKAREKWAGDL